MHSSQSPSSLSGALPYPLPRYLAAWGGGGGGGGSKGGMI